MRDNPVVSVLRGYARLGRSLIMALLLAGGLALASFLLAFPLWYVSVNASEVYSVAVGVVVLLGLALFFIRKIRNAAKGQTASRYFRFQFLPFLGKTGLVLACAVSAYAALFFFSHFWIIPGIAGSLTALFLLGLSYAVIRRRRDSLPL